MIIKITRFILPAFFCCILSCGNLFSQGEEKIPAGGIRKNAVYLTAGTLAPMEFYFSIMGNYERMIISFPKSCLHSFWIRAGGGPWLAWGSSGVNFASTISALFGRRSLHIETGPGIVFTYWPDERRFHPLLKDRYAAGFVGFRYQKPGGYFVLRTGIGWPEGTYVSLGFSF